MPTTHRSPVTTDDLAVADLSNALARLPQYGNAPGISPADLPAYMRGDGAYPREDGFLDMETILDDFADTGYGAHLAHLVDWAESATPVVDIVFDYAEVREGTKSEGPNITTELGDDDVAERISLSCWMDERESYSPYHCRVDYWFSGDIQLRLAAYPTAAPDDPYDFSDMGQLDVQTIMVDTPLNAFEPVHVITKLDEAMPFVASRVQELDAAGIPPSQAKYTALNEAGLEDAAIADRMGVQEQAIRSYGSRYSTSTEEAIHAFISNAGAPFRIVASRPFEDPVSEIVSHRYVCVPSWYASTVRTPDGYNAPLPGGLLVKVGNADSRETTDGRRGYTSYYWTLDVETESFRTFADLLDHLDEKVENAGHRYFEEQWRGLREDVPEMYTRLSNRSRPQRMASAGPTNRSVEHGGWWA